MKQPGLFDKLVTIEREGTPVPNGSGGYRAPMVVLKANVWANIRPGNGNRTRQFEKVEHTQDDTVRLLYNPTLPLTTECRFIYKNKILTIASIQLEEEKEWVWVCQCSTDTMSVVSPTVPTV